MFPINSSNCLGFLFLFSISVLFSSSRAIKVKAVRGAEWSSSSDKPPYQKNIYHQILILILNWLDKIELKIKLWALYEERNQRQENIRFPSALCIANEQILIIRIHLCGYSDERQRMTWQQKLSATNFLRCRFYQTPNTNRRHGGKSIPVGNLRISTS